HLRRYEVLGLPADLPDPAIRLAPVGPEGLHGLLRNLPDTVRNVAHPVRLEAHEPDDVSPDVVLLLVVGAIADADGARSVVSVEVRQLMLLQVGLAADAIHDLEVLPRAERIIEKQRVV